MGEPKNEIMEATREALEKHGYSELSIQKIADEFSKSKSLLYHHYDDKEDLMLAFLEEMNENMNQQLCISKSEPENELDQILEKMLGLENQETWELRKAILEMKSEAPYNQKFADKITEIDQKMHQIIEKKLKQMKINNTDIKANLILSAVEGAIDRKLSKQDKTGLEQQKKYIKKIIDLEF